jgi:hypothetical protein
LRLEAQAKGAKIFFADEAHFRADADLRGKWVIKGQPALRDSTSPRWGEKPSTTRRSVWRRGSNGIGRQLHSADVRRLSATDAGEPP